MIPKLTSEDLIRRLTPMVALVLAAAALLGTTVRADSSSDSSGIKTATPGAKTDTPGAAASLGSRLTIGKSAEVKLSGEGDRDTIGESPVPKEAIEAPLAPQLTDSTLMDTTGNVAKVTDMPVIAAPTAGDGVAGTEAAGMRFLVGTTLRLLVFVIAGVLLMWHLQRRSNTRGGTVRAQG